MSHLAGSMAGVAGPAVYAIHTGVTVTWLLFPRGCVDRRAQAGEDKGGGGVQRAYRRQFFGHSNSFMVGFRFCVHVSQGPCVFGSLFSLLISGPVVMDSQPLATTAGYDVPSTQHNLCFWVQSPA